MIISWPPKVKLHNVLLGCRWKKTNRNRHSSTSFGHVVPQFWPTFYIKRGWGSKKPKRRRGPFTMQGKIAKRWVENFVGHGPLFAHQGGHSIHFLDTSCLICANLRSTKLIIQSMAFQLCTLHDNNWLLKSTCQIGVILEAWHLRLMYIMLVSILTSSMCVHFLFQNLYSMHIPLTPHVGDVDGGICPIPL